MFLLLGFRAVVARLATLVMQCPQCHRAAKHQLVRRRSRFTVFFVPLFTVRTRHYLVCTLCGRTGEVPRERVADIEAEAQHQQVLSEQPQYVPFDPRRVSPFPQNLSPN